MDEPAAGKVYLISLCSGELRQWRHLGVDGRGSRWWRDCETGAEFSEGSLMYAWTVLGEAPPDVPAA